MIRFKRAAKADLAVLRKLFKSTSVIGYAAKNLTRAIDQKQCLMLLKNDTVVGFAVSDRNFFGRDFIALVVVHPKFRRQGLASKLIRRIESSAAGDVFTSTNQSNSAMKRLLKKMGYRKCGFVSNLDEGDPEIIYSRQPGRDRFQTS